VGSAAALLERKPNRRRPHCRRRAVGLRENEQSRGLRPVRGAFNDLKRRLDDDPAPLNERLRRIFQEFRIGLVDDGTTIAILPVLLPDARRPRRRGQHREHRGRHEQARRAARAWRHHRDAGPARCTTADQGRGGAGWSKPATHLGVARLQICAFAQKEASS
jgi:hypothetical protein